MDLSNLRDQVSNLTLYDIKAGVRKVQNGEIQMSLALLLLSIACCPALFGASWKREKKKKKKKKK